MNSSNADEDGDGTLDGLNLTGIYGDEFFDKQWHISSIGKEVNDYGFASVYGNDLNVMGLYHRYMGYNGGTPVIVQVVDDGVDADHEDLVDNMDLTRSYYGDTPTVGDPSPDSVTDTHGTMVAGIIGARAFNGKGVRGIAPFVKLAGSNFLSHQTAAHLDAVWYSGDGANEIAVSNNSWGSYYNASTVFEETMALGTSNLRDGKGRIYVIAAGNDRENTGNTNLKYATNNRYPIVVGALRHDNTHSVYSTPGSSILVSGYAGDYYYTSPTIATTTVMGQSTPGSTTWESDTNGNYTYIMNGTSAASPTVSGAMALVLEACPNLTWRDVKYLTAKNAIQVDSDNASWVQNGAGLWHSTDYGYGLVNPQGMIAECTGGYSNLPAETNFDINGTLALDIPYYYDSYTALNININASSITTVNNIEWVELTLDSNHSYAGDLQVYLTSPAGTTTMLLQADVNVSEIGSATFMSGGHRMGSAAFYDENATGTWSVYVYDLISDDSGGINALDFKVYGH